MTNRDDRLGKVCILGLNYPPETTGIAPYTGALARHLADAGYEVSAHVSHPHYPAWRISEGYGDWRQTERLDGVEVQRRRHYVPQPPRGIRRLLSELSFGVRIAAARWYSPDVVIAVSPALFSTALAVLRLQLTPRRPHLIVWVQDVYSLGIVETQEGGSWVERITRWVEGAVLRAADRVVVIHPRFADVLVGKLGVSSSRVEVVRNWTHIRSTAAVDSEGAKARLGWPSGVTLAVHTGNMGVKQGLENIVDAARLADEQRRPVQFILVGDGGERQQLERYASGIERLSFVDPLSDDDYQIALAAADVLLVNEKPGVSEMALPSKLTAYFDAERPVVAAVNPLGITASEVSTAADAGLVVPADEPAALLGAVLALRDDHDAAARYAANGRRHRDIALGEGAAIDRWLNLIATGLAR